MTTHRLALAAAAATVAVMLLAPASAQNARENAVRRGPAGDAFYTPPSPLPPGKPGAVIWTRPFAGTMALPGAERTMLVLYRSPGGDGRSTAVSGTVSIPQGEPPRGGWPVITWTHGTTGLAPECAPSRDTPTASEHDYIVVIRDLLDGFVRKGYAVVASDYAGLGTPGDHPFLQGGPTGRNALDMLRAARAIEPRIGTRYAVMGHSQGGQVDLFAAKLGPSYLREFDQVGNVAFAPGSHIEGRLRAVMASPKTELALPYVLYTLGSYAKTNRAIDLSRILTPQALSHMPDLKQGCMTGALTKGYWSSAIAKEQFLPNADIAAFLRMAKANEPGLLRIAAPTMILQGTADTTVLPADTDKVAADLCERENTLTYRALDGADHDGAMSHGGTDALAFIDARFKGEPAESNCKSLPKAGK